MDVQPHYIYSPRELTRWVRGIYEAIRPLDTLSPEMLVRTWAHEVYEYMSRITMCLQPLYRL